MPEISKIKLTSGAEYDIKDATAREMILSHTHTNESMGFGYGTCSTDEPLTNKTVSISNYKLTNGGIVSIKFKFNVPAGSTLNINNTGNKYICYNGVAITNGIIRAGDTATFIYSEIFDVYNLIATNNVTNESMGCGFGTCNTAASTTTKIVSISGYILSAGGIVSIKFTNKVTAGSTLNINSKGAKSIYYNGSAITDGIINAGYTATFIYDGTNYNLISLDRDFNKKETGTLSCSLISHLNRYDINNSNSTYNLTGTYIKYNDLVRIYISLEINNLVVMTNNNNITYYIMSFNTNLPLPDSTISERFNLNINDFSAFDYNDETKTINFKSNSYHNIKWIGYIKSGKITLCLIAKNPDGSCSNFKLNISGEYPI